MATSQALTAKPVKMAHKLREVSEITSIGYDRLRAYIDSGELKAKRNRNEDGEPKGPFIVMARDLESFLDSLPDA